MKIKILGTRANIETAQPLHIKHTGVLIDNKFLVDIGEKEFLSEKPQYIFITHLHPDHAFFEYPGNELDVNSSFRIYAPQLNNKIKEINVVDENQVFNFDGYIITPIPIIHSIKVKSFGYIIENKLKRVFFSGDVAWIEKKNRDKLGELDLVITEGSYLRKGGLIRRDKKSGNIFGHKGISDLVKMFKPYTRHIVIIHLGTWFMKDVNKGNEKILNLGDKNLLVEAANDGQLFEV